MYPYQNIIFDLDGTLTDPGEGITNSVAYALRSFGIEVPPREKLYPFIGPPLIDSFMKYYDMDEQSARSAVDKYREYFSAGGLFENKVYDGIPALLAGLKSKGMRLYIATSKPEGYTLRIIHRFGLDKFFDFVAGSTMDSSRVKKSDVIKYLFDSVPALKHERCVMIGDRHHDIEGARQNGIDSVGVLWGYGDKEELTGAGALYAASDITELRSILGI